MTTLAHAISRFTHSLRYEEIPEKTIHELKRRMIDSLGCAIGAFSSKPGEIARKIALSISSLYGSSLLGKKHKTSPDYAAFANGVLIRYLDYNDTYLSKEPAHPSDNLSAALAIGEAEHASGKRLLTALLAGYEIQCRLCDTASLRLKGWDHVVYGVFSTSMIAAKLLNFDIEQMIHTLGIAGVANNALRQTRVGELSMWKGAAFANAARNGVFASLLVKQGMTGPAPIFEGEKGFFKIVSGPLAVVFGNKEDGFRIMDSYIKYYPAEYHSQSAIGAALELRPSILQAGGTEQIQSIEIKTPQASYEIIGRDKEKWMPQSRETADHSLPYCTGIAFLDGKVELEQFSENRIFNPEVIDFLKRIRITWDRALDQEYPEGIPNEVIVSMKSGKTFSKKILYPKGHPKNPLTDREVEDKFKRLGRVLYTPVQLDQILETLWRIDEMEDCNRILDLFSLPE